MTSRLVGRGRRTMPVQSPRAYAGPASFLRAPRGKKLAHQLHTLLGLNSALHLHPMIQPRMPDQIPYRPAHPRLLVIRPEHQLPDFGQHDRPRALRARLDRNVERAVGKTIRLERVERALDREKLGMIGGILAGDRLVMRLGDDLIAAHHHRTDRNLVLRSSKPRLCKRIRHTRPSSPVPRPRFRHGQVPAPSRTATNSRPSPGPRAPDRPRRTVPPAPPRRADSAITAGSRASAAGPRTQDRNPRPPATSWQWG